jgi:hypothetical protein
LLSVGQDVGDGLAILAFEIADEEQALGCAFQSLRVGLD